jgi:hypothetical protein
MQALESLWLYFVFIFSGLKTFDKQLNDWPIENESKNAASLRVKTLSSPVLMYSYVPNKYYFLILTKFYL